MDELTTRRLVALNSQFYQTFAQPFSRSRRKLQPGIMRVINEYLLPNPITTSILDLGCGNGEFAHTLFRLGYRGAYTGVDFTPEFLEEAQHRALDYAQNCVFLQADLISSIWVKTFSTHFFNAIVSFAALHHIPSTSRRLELLKECHTIIKKGGVFILSVWQFHHSPRLTGRIVPCERVGFQTSDLEPGDTIIDWKQDGYGFRYVHLFNEDELAELARDSGFTIQDSFYSDGREGNLALYQMWKSA
jgi:SAM-dependent methyltransferase